MPRQRVAYGLISVLLASIWLTTNAFSEGGEFPPAPAKETSHAQRTWTTADGLPQNTVNVTLQTSDGFLWVGTNAGLVRFDGARFRPFGLLDGLPSVRISALVEDSEGALWIGTSGGGICRLKEGRFETFGPESGFPTSADVIALATERNGTVWVGTAGGLVRGRNGIFKMVGEEAGLPQRQQIRALATDSEGGLWVSVILDSLYEGRNGRFTKVEGKGPVTGDVYSLLVDNSGAVWAGAGNGKLWRKANGEWRCFDTSNGLPTSRFLSLAQDRDGTLWVAGKGLYRMSGDGFVPGFPGGAVMEQPSRGMTIDREGSIWAGIGNEGLSRFSPRVVQYWGQETGLRQSAVTSFVEDQAGGWWVGSAGLGVLRYEGNKFVPVEDPALKGNQIYAMAAMHDGSVWAAGEQTLARFKAGEPTKIFLDAPIKGEALRALCPDGDTLWMGTYYSSLLKIDAEGPRVVEPAGSFRGSITCIVSEGPETLWIGSFGGLHRWERGKIQMWSNRDGLLSSSILTIHREADGTLWLGTLGGGLTRMKGGRFTHITTRQGLIDDVISQIIVDDFGAFWLGTNRGIMRLERSELDDFMNGRTSEVHPMVFDRNEGLLKEQCSGGSGPTAFKTKDGRLFFPMTRGLAAIDPRQFHTPATNPFTVRIDDWLVNRSRQPMSSKTTLPPGTHRVEINYTIPVLRAGDWVRFRHRLEGLDKAWVPAGPNRHVSYDGLSPGEYRFRVEASDGQGNWRETETPLAFAIQPRVWQTLWFRVGGSLLLAAVASAAVWSHQRRKHHRTIAGLERERQQQADLAHAGRLALLGELSASLAHELKQPLAAILSNAQAGLRFLKSDEIGELQPILSDIAEADRRASEIITRMRDMIQKGEAQLEERDLNADLQHVLILLRADLLARNVSVDIKLEPGLPVVCGDHIQLQQVLLNLIINGCDSMDTLPAEERKIVIETARKDARFARVSVIDRGAGIAPGMMERMFEPFFSTKSHGLGMGLSICRAIVKAHGGQLWAENNPDRGATFHFTLRVGPEEQRCKAIAER